MKTLKPSYSVEDSRAEDGKMFVQIFKTSSFLNKFYFFKVKLNLCFLGYNWSIREGAPELIASSSSLLFSIILIVKWEVVGREAELNEINWDAFENNLQQFTGQQFGKLWQCFGAGGYGTIADSFPPVVAFEVPLKV